MHKRLFVCEIGVALLIQQYNNIMTRVTKKASGDVKPCTIKRKAGQRK